MIKISKLFHKDEPQKEIPMIEIQMENGTIERYPENFVIDEDYCVKCGNTYHWHLDCPSFKRQRQINSPIIAMKRIDAEHQGLDKCYQCQKYDNL